MSYFNAIGEWAVFAAELFTEQPSYCCSLEGSRWSEAARGWSVVNAKSPSEAIDFCKREHPFGSEYLFVESVKGVLVRFQCRRVESCSGYLVTAYYDIVE